MIKLKHWKITALSLLICLTACTDKPQTKPNVLIIMFDDLRFDTFSYRGGPVDTPNIDALAAQSVRFDNAMTTTGLCSPSRAALFTGRWGHRTGLDDNVDLYHSRLSGLAASEGGLIKRASDAGYMVGYVGKWHLGVNGATLRGAEFATGKDHSGKPHNPRPYTPRGRVKSVERYNRGELDANDEKHAYYQTLKGRYEDTPTGEKTLQGQELLRRAAADDRPFFGVVSYHQPHPPYQVPEPYASMFDPDKLELPANYGIKRVGKPMSQDTAWWPWHDTGHLTEADWRRARAHYYGAVAMIDRAVGDLIQTARDVGLYDDLRIIFISDQGSMIGEHGLYDKGPYAYDELMRIPLLIRSPDFKPKAVERQVSLLDIAPTLAGMMGLGPDGAADGRSLMPLLEGGDKAVADPTDQAFYAYEWYNGAWFGLRAIRTPESKFIWNPGEDIDELYDLEKDPGETVNLITDPDYFEVRANLVKRLEAELIRTEDPAIARYRRQMDIYEDRL